MEGANMEGAYMARANMAGANMAGANMARANMAGANMEGANMEGTYMARAIGAPRLIQAGPLGSRRGFTVYDLDKDLIQCGCYTGTLGEFAAKCEKTHADNPKCLAEYRAFIGFVEKLKASR